MATPLAPLLRKAAIRNAVVQNARMAPRYAGKRQASGHAVEAGAAEQYPEEGTLKLNSDEAIKQTTESDASSITAGFHGPFWRNTALAVLLSFAVYTVSLSHAPAAKPINLEQSHDPNEQPVEAKDKDMPYLTRYLAYHMPREGLWKERNDKHLELTVKAAEDQLLVQDAQRPKIRRLRYAGAFEQASPHGQFWASIRLELGHSLMQYTLAGIPVGSTIDLSDLQVKTSFAKPQAEKTEDSEDE